MSNLKKIIKKIVPEFVLKMRREFMLDQQRKNSIKDVRNCCLKLMISLRKMVFLTG